MKKTAFLMIAILFAALLPRHAAQAAEQQKVILNVEQEKAAVEVEIPDDSEGVSTLRLRVRIEGDMERLDSSEPIKFVPGETIEPVLLESRYNSEKGYYTVYLSGAEKITDKSRFLLGYFVPNLTDSKEGRITVSVPENGLEYVDGTGQLNDAINLQPSTAVLDMNQPAGNPQDNEENIDGGSSGDGDEGVAGGSDGESADGLTEDLTNTTADGSGSVSGGTTETNNIQNSDNTGADITAVQTGDNISIIPLCIIAVISVFAAISVLIMRRMRK